MNDFKTKGRRSSALELEILGEVTSTDLLEREEGGLSTSEAPTIAKIRGVHHEIAQLLASGLTETEVSAATSYSLSRISILKNDPSFKDLVKFYEGQKKEVFVNVQKRLSTLAMDAIGELQERLAEKPDTLSNTQLTEIAKVSLDRAGFSPVAKTQNISVSMTADELAELRKAAKGGRAEVVASFEQLEAGDETSD